MRLDRYLELRAEAPASFARRAGISRQLLRAILNGSSPTARTALKVVRATEAEPARGGGTVRLEDLV